MGIGDWHRSRCRTVRLGQTYTETDQDSQLWTKLWRIIRREIKKKKNSSKSTTVSLQQASYDRDTYLQNFDEGSRWTEPDLPRCFSTRFADPSRLQKISAEIN